MQRTSALERFRAAARKVMALHGKNRIKAGGGGEEDLVLLKVFLRFFSFFALKVF